MSSPSRCHSRDVGTLDDDAVARFDRDPETGALTYQGCITGERESGPAGTSACAAIGRAVSNGTNSGLDKLRSVAVSPSGTSLYVSSPADDSVARFDRDPATGALVYEGCTTGEVETGPTATNACARIPSASSFGASSGVDNPQSLTVTADERSLYLASGNDAAVARFDLVSACPLDLDLSGGVGTATDVVYLARHLFEIPPVPPSFRISDPTIPPDDDIVARIEAAGDLFDVDGRGGVAVATDVVYIARHAFGLPPVPPSFRVSDPTIPSDGVIAATIDTLCD